VGRAFLPDLLRLFMSTNAASSLGPSISSMMIYLVMAAVLVFRPEGLFPASNK
jgi:branched-chain amino acid transport system permease protein